MVAQLDPEREAQAATDVLNRVLFAHRIAGAAAHIHEVSPAQALVLRAGFGEGEHVAEGLWSSARELLLSASAATARERAAPTGAPCRAVVRSWRAAAVRGACAARAPGPRRQAHRAGRDRAGARLCGRAAELAEETREDLRERIEELRELRPGVAQAACAVIPAETPAMAPPNGDTQPPSPPAPAPAAQELPHASASAPDAQTVRHALERLEAALRARTARGFTLR